MLCTFNLLSLYQHRTTPNVPYDNRERSAGVSFAALTSLLKQIGWTEAMNLDGGGSTTFWLNGKV